MQLKSILNSVEKQKGFVYEKAEWSHAGNAIFVTLRPHGRSKPVCSGCKKKCSGYDRLPERTFQFIPLWNIPVLFLYAMRRVNCSRCGIVVEQVPWCHGKQRTTLSYRIFLARWARSLSWQETARRFGSSWDTVYRSIQWVVQWGLSHREFGEIEAIGVDEIQYRRGHKYLTLVYQVDGGCRRLLYVSKDRTEQSFRGFFQILPKPTLAGLKFICSDMWSNYLKVAAAEAGHAIRILDRFHVMKKFNDKINVVRATEAKNLHRDGYEPVLKNSRWTLLKRPENLTDNQTVKLKELLQYNLRSVRAYLMREDFQRFWEYRSATWAGRFLDQWCTRAMRSQIDPMKQMARTLRNHRELLLNWFAADGKLSSGCVEGLNAKAKLAMKKAYGFKSYETIEIALYHQLGKLPEPKTTHTFC